MPDHTPDQTPDQTSAIGARLYRIGAMVGLACMVALFGAGLALVVWAVWIGVTVTFQSGVVLLLKGIELLLLAPLAYLVLATMTTLVINVQLRLAVLNRRSNQPTDSESRLRLEEAFEVVHGVKQSVAGLFVALLLTDFIAKVLNREVLTLLQIVAETSALVVGVLYYGVQVRSSKIPHH